MARLPRGRTVRTSTPSRWRAAIGAAARAAMSITSTVLSPVASTIIGGIGGGYNATDPRRKILDPAQHLLAARTTANQLLNGSRAQLRAYCRQIERNNPQGQAITTAIETLVVGNGIDLEPDTGDEELDEKIRAEFVRWGKKAGIHGQTIFELQSQAARELGPAGEAVWRLVYDETADAAGEIPLRILPLDSEWLVDDAAGSSELTTVAGISIDRFGRPLAYMFRNPETDSNEEIVPASSVIHIFHRKRPVQNRGEPMFAPIIETLIQERDLVDAELYAAKQTAALGIAVESEWHPDADRGEAGDEGYGTEDDPVSSVSIGNVVRLLPGEKVHPFGHTRPSQQIAPFRKMLHGDTAAAMGIPLRLLDRDISDANYSSMRADMIDSERIMGPRRAWFGRMSIGRCYETLLPLIAARLGVPTPRADYRLIPDGQPYVDPEKDVKAAADAIAKNLSTYEIEIGKRGGDYRKVFEQRLREVMMMEEMQLPTTEKIPQARPASPTDTAPITEPSDA